MHEEQQEFSETVKRRLQKEKYLLLRNSDITKNKRKFLFSFLKLLAIAEKIEK